MPCTFLVTFRGRRKGNLVFWFKVVTGAGDQSCFMSMCKILWQAQYFGHGGGLRCALISSRFWTLGSFSEVGGSLETKLRLEVLLLRIAFVGAARCES